MINIKYPLLACSYRGFGHLGIIWCISLHNSFTKAQGLHRKRVLMRTGQDSIRVRALIAGSGAVSFMNATVQMRHKGLQTQP
ncbi:hypothetical protein R3I94_012447 [Phoxinus phoxinus]